MPRRSGPTNGNLKFDSARKGCEWGHLGQEAKRHWKGKKGGGEVLAPPITNWNGRESRRSHPSPEKILQEPDSISGVNGEGSTTNPQQQQQLIAKPAIPFEFWENQGKIQEKALF
jgi:hypothetical protein